MTKINTKRDVEQTAAEWLVRVQEPDVTEKDLVEWDAWLKADKRHRRAFDALEAASAFIAREQTSLSDIPLPDDTALSTDNYAGDAPIADYIDQPTNKKRPATHSSKQPTVGRTASLSAPDAVPSSVKSPIQRPNSRWAIAATVLLTIGVTTWFTLNDNWLTPTDTQLKVVETQESEHRRIDLDDGSTIELGAASSLSVNYSSERRTVVLEAGEALFEVAKDPQRPFVVLAGNGTITAVGTAFNVRRDADRVVVTVTEGEVEVVQQGGSITQVPDDPLTEIKPPARQSLAVGERVEYSAAGIARLENVAPAVATEWRNGRLRYRAESLKHVIPDVDRYSPQTVIIGDAAVGELQFTGTVFQDNADEWLRGLEAVFPVEVVELDDQQLLLRLRNEDQ